LEISQFLVAYILFDGNIIFQHALKGNDKFTHIHPNTNWESGLKHGGKIGLGTQKYEMIIV
jgi:uncharacterized Fe-S center protein